MHAKYFLIFAMTILSFTSPAQSRFSVDDSVRLVSGGTSWGVLHHFIQANNKVGDTLNMRWRKTVKGNPPQAWTVNFADPESNHIDIGMIDSVDFIFPDSSSNHTFNKFVIGIKPNGALGSGSYTFTIFEKQFPADSVRITFNVQVYTGVGLFEWKQELSAYPNPASDYVYIPSLTGSARVSLYDMKGVELPNLRRINNSSTLNVSQLPGGTYLIRVEEENDVQLIKISIEY